MGGLDPHPIFLILFFAVSFSFVTSQTSCHELTTKEACQKAGLCSCIWCNGTMCRDRNERNYGSCGSWSLSCVFASEQECVGCHKLCLPYNVMKCYKDRLAPTKPVICACGSDSSTITIPKLLTILLITLNFYMCYVL